MLLCFLIKMADDARKRFCLSFYLQCLENYRELRESKLKVYFCYLGLS